jgi:tRNA A37 methylthiotransferase MiaB
MVGQINQAVSKERGSAYRTLFDNSAEVYRRKFIGDSVSVLWESMTQLNERGWQMEGLTGNYLRVTAAASSPRWNIVDDVKLTGLEGDVLLGGEIIGSL